MGKRSMNPETEDVNAPGEGAKIPVVSPGRESPWMRRVSRGLWGLAALAVMGNISYFTVRLTTPQVVTFDLKGTLDLFMQQTAQQKLDESRMKMMVTDFNAAMADSLYAWQSAHNAIILVQPAVVSVQHDITPDIRNDIARRMQAGQPLSLRGTP